MMAWRVSLEALGLLLEALRLLLTAGPYLILALLLLQVALLYLPLAHGALLMALPLVASMQGLVQLPLAMAQGL
jgi:hypothetical protein